MRVTARSLHDKMQKGRTYTLGQLMVMTQTTIGQCHKALITGEPKGLFRRVGVEWEKV